MVYNLTTFNASYQPTFLTYFNFANEATNGMFGIFFLLAFFVTMFISMKAWSTDQALATSSFLTLIIALAGSKVGMIPPIAVMFAIIIFALAIVFMYMK